MLRARPEHCPLCGHDVRGVVCCAGCGEPLFVAGDASPAPAPVRALGAAGAVLAGGTLGLGIAVAAVLHPLLGLGVAATVPVTAGTAGAIGRLIERYRRRPRRQRDEDAPPPDESIGAARQALAAGDGAVVTVRGRVHLEIPVLEGTDHAVARGTAGRFVVHASDGAALVDDDHVAVSRRLVVRHGDLVEVTGPARLVHDAAASDYRAAGSRVVFSATRDTPLRLRRI